ncbi:MBL fold metallo-hydrolase [bacterium]|nr:MBL fold metallo-hydrolase [bacterium]
MISLLVLGTGGGVPIPGRAPTSNLVTVDGQKILVDLGPGALSRLVSSPHGPDSLDEIDTILFTHLHPDHCNDIVHLLFAMRCPALESKMPLLMMGPPGLANYMSKLKELYGDWLNPLHRQVVITEFSSDETFILENGGAVTPFIANHSENRFSKHNFGYCFSDKTGSKVVISGDGGPSKTLENVAKGCDLLLIECSTPDELAVDGHMTPARVAGLCNVTRPKKTVLNHFYPAAAELDLAKLVYDNYDGSVVMANDGDFFTVDQGK